MKKTIRFYIIAVIFLTIFSNSKANIINIPNDYIDIQLGINSANNHDTVLVQPGTYIENINFNGHNIILSSNYLFSNDTSIISQTIIDGNSAGAVITIESGEDSSSAIIGFTIQNGLDTLSGGILCINSNTRISNNIIKNNHTDSFNYNSGGGISCGNSESIIENNIIIDNEALNSGCGGIFCLEANPTIIRNSIINNVGGGIHI